MIQQKFIPTIMSSHHTTHYQQQQTMHLRCLIIQFFSPFTSFNPNAAYGLNYNVWYLTIMFLLGCKNQRENGIAHSNGEKMCLDVPLEWTYSFQIDDFHSSGVVEFLIPFPSSSYLYIPLSQTSKLANFNHNLLKTQSQLSYICQN